MIDSHCHLNVDPLYKNWQLCVDEAGRVGVSKILVLGVDLDTNRKAIKMAENDAVWIGLGLHPELVSELMKRKPNQSELLMHQYQQVLIHQLNEQKERVRAIGECGLDYYRLNEDVGVSKKLQQELLVWQLELANERELPVSIHIRDAVEDTLKLISLYRPMGVWHCFSGSLEQMRQAVGMGLYISFGGNVTYANTHDLSEVAKITPSNRLLVETDAPYLNPYRGQFPNKPANITKTYEYLAKLRKVDRKTLEVQVEDNFRRLFGD